MKEYIFKGEYVYEKVESDNDVAIGQLVEIKGVSYKISDIDHVIKEIPHRNNFYNSLLTYVYIDKV